MKAKNQNKKFNLDKFEIAKLTNAKSIVGGGGDNWSSDICTTDTNSNSSRRCFPIITAPPKDTNIGNTTAP